MLYNKQGDRNCFPEVTYDLRRYWYEKNGRLLAILLACLLLCGMVPANSQASSTLADKDSAVSTVIADEGNNYVMTGPSGTKLLVKSISSAEYKEMMSLMYPNGIVDEQGQEIGAVENAQEVRANFIAQHMKAYWVQGTEKIQVSIIPVTIPLSNPERGVLFYKASIGQDTFVFPSEWGRQGFGFDHRSEQGLFLAYTSEGIWRIDPTTMAAEKITADTYQGKSMAEVREDLKNRLGEHLAWIGSVDISPDGATVIYRTNRDTDILNDTSIWKIDLDTMEEEQLLAPTRHNNMVGFLSDNCAVVGSTENTRMVDVDSGKVIALEFPVVPNFHIDDVGGGKVAFSSYASDKPGTTVYVSQVDKVTGSVIELARVTGHIGKLIFSPSEDKVAIEYGTDHEKKTDDIVIVDTTKNIQVLLSNISAKRAASTAQNQKEGKIDITNFCWLNNDTLLLEQETYSTDNDNTTFLKVMSASEEKPYDIIFGSIPPSIEKFNSPLAPDEKSGFVSVNSKWNQPRNVKGTNPHNGVDLYAREGTPVYAPYAGWTEGIWATGDYDIQLLVDANNNKIKDDGDNYVRFYHMSSREKIGYKAQGELIGRSGNAGGVPDHLHFGICSLSGGLKWLRNEVNYRYLANENNEWNAGKDLDIYAYVSWDYGTASLDAYILDDCVKKDLAEVRMFYRLTTSGEWIDGGIMQKSGDTYSYNFREILPRGTTVYWMVRLTRSGISQRAFCPALYRRPAADPNEPIEPYAYFTNVV